MEYNFGALLKGYRNIYKINQTKLGDIMLCSRMTINTIEKAVNVSELSDDSLFKLYYFLSKYGVDDLDISRMLLEEVSTEIDNRINCHSENRIGHTRHN
jgi:transcriptional regulator with XRE-family HTH domain